MEQYRIGDVSRIVSKNKIADSKLSSLFTSKDAGSVVQTIIIPNTNNAQQKNKKTSLSLKPSREIGANRKKIKRNKETKRLMKKNFLNIRGNKNENKSDSPSENLQNATSRIKMTFENQKLLTEIRKNVDSARKSRNKTGSVSTKIHWKNEISTPNENKRTIFVGNMPNSVTKKIIKNLFKEFGKIESVRMRSVAVADINMPKKVAAIKRNFNSNRTNLNFYVKFVSEEDAAKALKMNGYEFKGFHLRVDIAEEKTEHDHHKSIFLGNLPYNIEEEAVRRHFEECGEIENVRIIRDSQTGVGKGFGFVTFKSADSVHLALQFSNKNLAGQEIRIKRSVKHNNTNGNNKQRITQQKRHKSREASTTPTFRGTMATPVSAKKKNKRKAKKQQRFY